MLEDEAALMTLVMSSGEFTVRNHDLEDRHNGNDNDMTMMHACKIPLGVTFIIIFNNFRTDAMV